MDFGSEFSKEIEFTIPFRSAQKFRNARNELLRNNQYVDLRCKICYKGYQGYLKSHRNNSFAVLIALSSSSALCRINSFRISSWSRTISAPLSVYIQARFLPKLLQVCNEKNTVSYRISNDSRSRIQRFKPLYRERYRRQ